MTDNISNDNLTFSAPTLDSNSSTYSWTATNSAGDVYKVIVEQYSWQYEENDPIDDEEFARSGRTTTNLVVEHGDERHEHEIVFTVSTDMPDGYYFDPSDLYAEDDDDDDLQEVLDHAVETTSKLFKEMMNEHVMDENGMNLQTIKDDAGEAQNMKPSDFNLNTEVDIDDEVIVEKYHAHLQTVYAVKAISEGLEDILKEAGAVDEEGEQVLFYENDIERSIALESVLESIADALGAEEEE